MIIRRKYEKIGILVEKDAESSQIIWSALLDVYNEKEAKRIIEINYDNYILNNCLGVHDLEKVIMNLDSLDNHVGPNEKKDQLFTHNSDKSDYFTEKLNKYINVSLNKLYKYDDYLILNMPVTNEGNDEKHHVGERAIVFRFAYYLQKQLEKDSFFKSYNLDCEYNRNGTRAKELPGFEHGTYPDVILHKRGSNDDNLLVIEFKTYWNPKLKEDEKKIKEFTSSNGEYWFHYGATVLINETRDAVQLVGYRNGHKLE